LSFLFAIIWFVIVVGFNQFCFITSGLFSPIQFYSLSLVLPNTFSMMNSCIIGDGLLLSSFISPDQIVGGFSQALTILDFEG